MNERMNEEKKRKNRKANSSNNICITTYLGTVNLCGLLCNNTQSTKKNDKKKLLYLYKFQHNSMKNRYLGSLITSFFHTEAWEYICPIGVVNKFHLGDAPQAGGHYLLLG